MAAAQTAESSPASREPSRFGSHRESLSWALFASIDRNSDDRVDVFEARAAFPDVETLMGTGVAAFRKIDRNHNGFLHWNEFDAHFRSEIARGNVFELVLARPAREPDDPSRMPMPATTGTVGGSLESRLQKRVDLDGDGAVSVDEFQRLTAVLNLPSLDAAQILPNLDTDRSGSVSMAELVPIVIQFKLERLLFAAPVRTARPTALPQDLQPADLDADGVLDSYEMERSLEELDPTLSRYAALIVSEADRNGNRRLGLTELRAAPRPLLDPAPVPVLDGTESLDTNKRR